MKIVALQEIQLIMYYAYVKETRPCLLFYNTQNANSITSDFLSFHSITKQCQRALHTFFTPHVR